MQAWDDDDGTLRRRFGIAAVLFTFCFVILLARLFDLQILQGDEYRERSKTSLSTTDKIPARRGELRDRTGAVLARNTPAFALKILPWAVRDAAVRGPLLRRLGELLELTWEQVEAVETRVADAITRGNAWTAIAVDEHLVASNCPYDGTALVLPDEAHTTPDVDARRQFFCHTCGLDHEPLAADAVYCPHDKTKLVWTGAGDHRHAECAKCKRSFVTKPICPNDGALMVPVDHNLVCPLCKRRFTDQVAVLKTSLDALNELGGARRKTDPDALTLETTLLREYMRPFDVAHTLGYMNFVTDAEHEANPGVYGLDSRIGRSGLEKALEPILRGQSGLAKYLKGTDRSVMREYQEPVPGHQAWLTIDLRLQRAVRDILRYQRSAAAVVMEPTTGEVLALYSHPGFDPNQWSTGLSKAAWDEITANPYDPLHNKAVTAYAPGSVFKIVTAYAGLHEGVVTPETTVQCKGSYHYLGRDFGCHAKNGHGVVAMVDAIKGSCDVYFYQLAQKLGMDRLAKYARELGFGELTGIEIAESAGTVPTERWLDDHTTLGFQPGLTLSLGIGQGSLTASPLQVARSFAAVANGGRLVRPQLVSQYTDEAGVPIQKFLPIDERTIGWTPDELTVIRRGLIAVVNEQGGTAREVADDVITIAGKTGTAEAEQTRPNADEDVARWLKEDHAWFALFAPVEAPQVVIVVFIEHGGGGGANAAPLAKRIFDAWRRLGLYHGPVEGPDVDGHDGGGAPGGGGAD